MNPISTTIESYLFCNDCKVCKPCIYEIDHFMTSSKPTKPFIHHKPALAWINKLESTKTALIKKSGIFQSDLPIELDRSLKSFQFSFDYGKQFDLHENLDLGPYKEELPLSGLHEYSWVHIPLPLSQVQSISFTPKATLNPMRTSTA